MNINFTIVIPHKNVPDLLERLISSIPFREDLEIIVVDDHSDADVVERLRKLERGNITIILITIANNITGIAVPRILPMYLSVLNTNTIKNTDNKIFPSVFINEIKR